MNPQLANWLSAVSVGLIIFIAATVYKALAGKANKADLTRMETESKAALLKLEVTLNAAMLVVGASITRPELAEKLLAMTGRADDRTEVMKAAITKLENMSTSNQKAIADTDKRLDDLPSRVRALEDRRER